MTLSAGALIGATALGGLFGSGSSALSSLMNYQSAKKLMDRQYNINLKTLRNAPSASRQGFVDAGFNPLLSLGSNQAGFSASSSGVGADLSSGVNAGVNSALAYKENKATLKKLDAEINGIEETTRGIELDNRIKEKELNTSPKSIISDYVEGRENPVVKKIQEIGERFGVLDSNKSKPNSAISAKSIQLHDNKPYVQRGVPRSVVKSFNGVNSAKSAERFTVLSDRELKNYKPSKRRYSKPPNQLPR